VGRGVESGGCDLVCKISDSYLGIGDRGTRQPPRLSSTLSRTSPVPLLGDIVFKRGVDFATHGDIEAALRADARYAGRPAVLCEMVQPCAGLEASVSSDGHSAVHSLDIVTLRTREGAKVL